VSQVQGVTQVVARLGEEALRHRERAARALYAVAHEIRTESMRRTPVDTGALRSTHMVTEPEWSGNVVEVSIGVGGPAAPYAIYVHENLTARHTVGQAKFLESALLEALPSLARRVAARMAVAA
jgi:hypothetical protein